MSQEMVAPVKRTKLRVVSDVLLFVSTLLLMILSVVSFSRIFMKMDGELVTSYSRNAVATLINGINGFIDGAFSFQIESDIISMYQGALIVGSAFVYLLLTIIFVIMAIVKFAKKDSFKLSSVALNAYKSTLTIALMLAIYCVYVEDKEMMGTTLGYGMLAGLVFGAFVFIVASILNFVDNKNKVNPHTDGKKRWIAAFVTGIGSLILCIILLNTHIATVIYQALDEVMDGMSGFDLDELAYGVFAIMIIIGVSNANKQSINGFNNNFAYTLTYGIENEIKTAKKKSYSLVKFVSLIVFLSIALFGALLTNFDFILKKNSHGVFWQLVAMLFFTIGLQIALKVLVGKLVKDGKGVLVPESQKKYEEDRVAEELQKQTIQDKTVYVQPIPQQYAQAPNYQQVPPTYQAPVQPQTVVMPVEPQPVQQPIVEVAPAYEQPVQPQIEGWFCPTCGNKNSGNFCGRCGTKRP